MLGEALPIFAKARVERIISPRAEPVLNLVEQVVLMRAILVVEELTPSILQAVRLVVTLWRENETRFEK